MRFNQPKECCLVQCSAPDLTTARSLASLLLERKLAACVTILPSVESHYVWQESREQAQEVLLLVKSTKEAWPRLERTLRKNHPYNCPEILQLPVLDGHPAYLHWVADCVPTED